MKKILLGLGTLATIVAPLTAVVACGSESSEKKDTVEEKGRVNLNSFIFDDNPSRNKLEYFLKEEDGNQVQVYIGDHEFNFVSNGLMTLEIDSAIKSFEAKSKPQVSIPWSDINENNIISTTVPAKPQVSISWTNVIDKDKIAHDDFVSSIKGKTLHTEMLEKALSGNITLKKIQSLIPSFVAPSPLIFSDLTFNASVDRFSMSSTLTATYKFRGEDKSFEFSIDGFSKQEDFDAMENILKNAKFDVLSDTKFTGIDVRNVDRDSLYKQIANALILKSPDAMSDKDKNLFINSLKNYATFSKTAEKLVVVVKMEKVTRRFEIPIKLGLVELQSLDRNLNIIHQNDDNTLYTSASQYYYSNNRLYLSTVKDGKLTKETLTGITVSSLNDNTVYYQTDTAKYVGAADGLFKLENGSSSFVKINSSNMEHGFVYETKSGDLYLGTNSDGLKMIDDEDKTFDVSSIGVKDGFMFETSKGVLYLGTNSDGLKTIDENGNLKSIKDCYDNVMKTSNMKMYEVGNGNPFIVGENGIYWYSEDVKGFMTQDKYGSGDHGVYKTDLFGVYSYPVSFSKTVPQAARMKWGIIASTSPRPHTSEDENVQGFIASQFLLERGIIVGDPSDIDEMGNSYHDDSRFNQAIFFNNDIYLISTKGEIYTYNFISTEKVNLNISVSSDAKFVVDVNNLNVISNGVLYKLTNII